MSIKSSDYNIDMRMRLWFTNKLCITLFFLSLNMCISVLFWSNNLHCWYRNTSYMNVFGWLLNIKGLLVTLSLMWLSTVLHTFSLFRLPVFCAVNCSFCAVNCAYFQLQKPFNYQNVSWRNDGYLSVFFNFFNFMKYYAFSAIFFTFWHFNYLRHCN